MRNKWNDPSLGYIGLGCLGACMGVFSYGLLGLLLGLVIGLAYALSFVSDDEPDTWIPAIEAWWKRVFGK